MPPKPRIFVSTAPFGAVDPAPLERLRRTGWSVALNSTGRRLTGEELARLAAGADGLVAGTEDLTALVRASTRLRMIARVGIGIDSVPLALCREKGIAVSYTPDAVTDAVAELTVGLMIALTRQVLPAGRDMARGCWQRRIGRRLGEMAIGIVGLGRIGAAVARRLAPFAPRKLLVNDILDKSAVIAELRRQGLAVRAADKTDVWATADVVSLHVPLTAATRNLVDAGVLARFRPGAFLLNLARGGIVDEAALAASLAGGRLAGAAVDTFVDEPYHGPLARMENVIVTPHLGACAEDARRRMEIEATEDLIRFFEGSPPLRPVPPAEYEAQAAESGPP